MLVAIGVFRASGAMDALIDGVSWAVQRCGFDAQWVGALPTALMKPLSGSGARGMMVDAMTTHGADSFVGRLSCIFQGSTDTTFYILAVYFGSVGVPPHASRRGRGFARRSGRHCGCHRHLLSLLRLSSAHGRHAFQQFALREKSRPLFRSRN